MWIQTSIGVGLICDRPHLRPHLPEVPFPGSGMCSRTVVFGRFLAVPLGTKRPVTALRSPIRLFGLPIVEQSENTAWTQLGAMQS